MRFLVQHYLPINYCCLGGAEISLLHTRGESGIDSRLYNVEATWLRWNLEKLTGLTEGLIECLAEHLSFYLDCAEVMY